MLSLRWLEMIMMPTTTLSLLLFLLYPANGFFQPLRNYQQYSCIPSTLDIRGECFATTTSSTLYFPKQQQLQQDLRFVLHLSSSSSKKGTDQPIIQNNIVKEDKEEEEEEENKDTSLNQTDNNNDSYHVSDDHDEGLMTYSARFIDDNGLKITTDSQGRVTARPFVDNDSDINNDNINNGSLPKKEKKFPRLIKRPSIKDHPAQIVPKSGFNVVLTHCTADFDSLASAVGLAKLWSANHPNEPQTTNDQQQQQSSSSNNDNQQQQRKFDSCSHVPTFVVLPRGAHPSVQRFLALHKHLFPIRSLKSLPPDLSNLNRLGLVDAQRRDRIGPAENLLQHAKRVTIVDHHLDTESDITEATDYVVDKVGSVSTLICERLMEAQMDISEAEATLLALGIHADTGSLCFDSTTPRDAKALAWVMDQGASQAAIAEHAQSSLSPEQQGVLTQALIHSNSTVVHGVTISTVLLQADGFINGLAAVTQDALELSSSDIFILALVYEAKAGGHKKSKGNKANNDEKLSSRLLRDDAGPLGTMKQQQQHVENSAYTSSSSSLPTWNGKDEAMRLKRLRASFDQKDTNGSGFLEAKELSHALSSSGILATDDSVQTLLQLMDTNGDGRVDFEEFVAFAGQAEKQAAAAAAAKQREEEQLLLQDHDNKHGDNDEEHHHHNKKSSSSSSSSTPTMILIGRVKAGVNLKSVKLSKLMEAFGGGGHAKAASATVRLDQYNNNNNNDYDPQKQAEKILQNFVNDLIDTSLDEQPTVGDFMTAPVLSLQPHMTESQVEDLFIRYDVRALPVVDEENNVIGLVTYKEVAAAKQRLWNKEQKRLRQEQEKKQQQQQGKHDDNNNHHRAKEQTPQEQEEAHRISEERRKKGSTVKGWMKQHIQTVETSRTMSEVEAILLETDVGCIPVVADGTKQLVGMVTRTDLLRQHRYYPSLHYHNKGFSDSIAARKPIIELRRKLKRFDIEE